MQDLNGHCDMYVFFVVEVDVEAVKYWRGEVDINRDRERKRSCWYLLIYVSISAIRAPKHAQSINPAWDCILSF
jgi:hypothetical protein